MQNKAGIFLRLVKYQLSLTVSFSALTGYLLTGHSNGFKSLTVFTGVLLLASGASALNQIQERNLDCLMDRTKKRPLPSGEITLWKSVLISMLLILSGVFILLYLGKMPALLGLTNLVLYNLIYTPLKRITTFSILPGALVGAICPLIGWTAGDFPVFHPAGLFISIFVFLWQVPHFWLLLLQHSQDYKKAGFAGIQNLMNPSGIKILVFIWAVITSLFLFSIPFFGYHIKPRIIPFFIFLNLLFIFLFYRLLFQKKSGQSFRLAFILINSFVLIVFCLMIINRF